jgi:ribosomal protein S7
MIWPVLPTENKVDLNMEPKQLQQLLNNLMQNGKKQVAAKLLASSFIPHSAAPFLMEKLLQQSNPLLKVRTTSKGALSKSNVVPLNPREQDQQSIKIFLYKPTKLPRGYSAHLSQQLKDPTSLFKRLQEWFRSLFSSRS